MADKKITQLTEATSISQDDLLLIVDDPSGTPINKKITATNLFANVNHITSSVSGRDAIKATLTSNNAHGSTEITAGKFIVQKGAALSGNAQFAIVGKTHLQANTANVTHTHAVARLTLDVGNAVSLVTNTYGLLIEVANTNSDGTAATRQAQPRAFIAFGESVTTNSLSTQYVLDIGKNGTANVSANLTGANTGVVLSQASSTTITHKLKINVNGTDYWIALTSAI